MFAKNILKLLFGYNLNFDFKYALILLIILLAEIAFGIFAAVYAAKLKSVLSAQLDDSIKLNYYGDMSNKTLVSIAWDVIMYNVCRIYFYFFR